MTVPGQPSGRRPMRWVAAAAQLVVGSWMIFDGLRALVVGDYVTPREGRHAGRLGPWSRLFSSVGVDPRSTGVKACFVLLGVVQLGSGVCVATGSGRARRVATLAAASTLWYVPFGTVAGVVVLLVVRRELPSRRG